MTSTILKLSKNWQLGTIKDQSGFIDIRYGLYRTSEVPMNRCVVYLNGRTEWIEKNLELPEWLDLPADCGFLTLDHRGQGASGGERSVIFDYKDFADDTARVINHVLGTRIPYVVMSHSMGGLIALVGNMQGIIKPLSMALSAPLLAVSNQPFPPALSRVFSETLTFLGMGNKGSGAGKYDKKRFEKNRLTHNYEMYERSQNTPYPVGSATFRWVKATFRAMDFVHLPHNIAKLSAPTLILLAGDERVLDLSGQKRWIALAGKNAKVEVTTELIFGARHEIFSETDNYRKLAIAKIRHWFREFLK